VSDHPVRQAAASTGSSAAPRRPWADALDRWILDCSAVGVSRSRGISAAGRALGGLGLTQRAADCARIAHALGQPVDWSASQPLPAIEVFIPCHPRDLPFLARTLPVTLQSVGNPVSRVVIAAPADIVDTVRDRLDTDALVPAAGSPGVIDVQVVDERSICAAELRARIANVLPDRVGWLYAQALKLVFAEGSSARGVLLVDADTVLTRPRAWLDANGRQPLLPTYEWYPAYYQLLAHLGVPVRPNTSFIAHHMLIQPELLRLILGRLDIASVGELVDRVLSIMAANPPANCSEYELYAHGLCAWAPERFTLARWANVPTALPSAMALVDDPVEFRRFQRRFASLSAHGFIDPP